MRVRDIMKRHPRVARLQESLATVGKAMAEVDCGVLPVLDEQEVVVGVVTDRDICLALATRDSKPSDLTVEAVMSRPVYTSGPDATVAAALATMRERQVRRLPVVTETGEIEGLLCLDDVAREAVELVGDEPGRPAYTDIAETLAAINRPRVLSAAV